jgi:hypothetical protein
MSESAVALDTYLGRQTQQQRLGMGFAGDGSGGLNLDAAPTFVKRALLRGDGDKVAKLDPQAGPAVAPGVSGEVQVRVQITMRRLGIELSYGMVDNIVRMACHQLPISGMQCKGVSVCRIGEFTVKTNQAIDREMGQTAILEFLDNLILAKASV